MLFVIKKAAVFSTIITIFYLLNAYSQYNENELGQNILKHFTFPQNDYDTTFNNPFPAENDSILSAYLEYVETRSESTYQDTLPRHTPNQLGYTNALENFLTYGDTGIANILILGLDQGGKNRKRSDVIILLNITKGGKILTLSIPRDTKIELPSHDDEELFDKINHMYSRKKEESVKQAISELLSCKIDFYVTISNFDDFKRLLSLIGGVDVDKHVEGNLGIQWVRNRSFVMGDLDRCKRQQVFLKKFLEKSWEITELSDGFFTNIFIKLGLSMVETDLSIDQVSNYINHLKQRDFNPKKDVFYGHLPGSYERLKSPLYKDQELVYWIPDRGKIENISRVFKSY
ncbi:LCP family protein [bacterium]|nr:LCP family protein [bacterium]